MKLIEPEKKRIKYHLMNILHIISVKNLLYSNIQIFQYIQKIKKLIRNYKKN